MIPQFPEFKKLELSDKDEVESFTKKFPPYSDFNFISMWSWDVKGEMRLSWLNDNLVVRFSDYLTGQSFYSFLGDTLVNETTAVLIDMAKLFEMKSELSLVPEIAVQKLDIGEFSVIEQRDQFDYIYDLEIVSQLKGSQFAKKRTQINKFIKENHIEFKEIDITDPEVKFNIKRINLDWLDKKKKKDPFFEIKNELIAMDKFFDGKFSENIFAYGVYMNGHMAAYTVSEKLNDGYAMSHFSKADLLYRGIYEYMMQESAKSLYSVGCKYLNYEQDLGLAGLRESKEGFSTGIFLKQYRIVVS